MFFFILKFCIPLDLYAQSSGQQSKLISEQDLQQIIAFIEYNQNDSALIYIEPIWEELLKQELTESAFGLQVQLAKARALEQNHNHSEAILLFNELKTKSEATNQWEVYANTCLSLAQLYEKLYRQERSKELLDLAYTAIVKHQLNDLFPSFYFHKAIWNYTFGQHPDTLQYYSEKALSFVDDEDTVRPSSHFSLYMIKGISLQQEDPKAALEWYEKVVVVAKELNDPVKLSYIWNKLCKFYKRDLIDYKKALAYNDSTINICYQAIADGHERIYTLHDAYKERAVQFYIFEKWDSAFFYMNKGLKQEIAYIEQQQFDRVAEVDARYRDEQKNIQLEDQAKTILFEKRIRNLILIIFVITLILAIGLTIGLMNYRKSMQKLADQNQLIQEQSTKLKSLDTAKSRFFANVSHELRTPLTLILGPLKTALKSGTLNNRNFSLLTMARQNAQSLVDLVGSILDISRMEHGKLKLEEAAERLFPLLRRFVSTFESYAQREGIELIFNYQAEEDLQLQLDRIKLKTILNNLLSNAVKFTSSGGKIIVSVVDNGNAILISVKDTGRGITSRDLPYVFDRFYQSEEQNALTEGGTGIGLAFSKELITIMGGKIWVESQVKVGSTFYIELPRKEVLGVPKEGEMESVEAASTVLIEVEEYKDSNNGNRPTIMIVEDNYSLRDYLSTILNPYYEIIPARNGEEALNLLNENSNNKGKPSLIISDVMMPVMDGFQLMEQLKADERYNRVPLIMLTARADIKDKLKALRIGVDDYLLKPFDEEEVLVRIGNLLENYNARKEIQVENKTPEKEIPAMSQQDRQWLEKFEAYIQENLSNEMINVAELARHFTMSESSLLRQLKYLTGLTPAKYLVEMRLDKARQMLEQRVYNSVHQVANEVGYQDTRSFSRSFKKRFGKLPSAYLKTSEA